MRKNAFSPNVISLRINTGVASSPHVTSASHEVTGSKGILTEISDSQVRANLIFSNKYLILKFVYQLLGIIVLNSQVRFRV